MGGGVTRQEKAIQKSPDGLTILLGSLMHDNVLCPTQSLLNNKPNEEFRLRIKSQPPGYRVGPNQVVRGLGQNVRVAYISCNHINHALK